VADPSANDQNDASTADIHTEISTEVSHEGRGTVYAIKTVTQGDRRVDWKIGHIEGTFAEGAEYYYKGDDFHTDPLQRLPENAPRGRFKHDSSTSSSIQTLPLRMGSSQKRMFTILRGLIQQRGLKNM
jgi:hypothetical protein